MVTLATTALLIGTNAGALPVCTVDHAMTVLVTTTAPVHQDTQETGARSAH